MNNTDCFIPLTQGQTAICSPEDYEFLCGFKWCAQKSYSNANGYVWYAVSQSDNKKIRMHHLVAKRAELPESRQYDHRDRNGLNNTRENIRPCNYSQNGANSTKQPNTISKFKGVAWHKNEHKWHSRIMVQGRRIHLGSFEEEIDAHRAYEVAAIRYFGEFACP